MVDTYQNFDELESNEREGEDWVREWVDRSSRILVMAPHGGWIEPFTSELAREIAGDIFSFYTFQGTKPAENQRLHLTSHQFDEPVALEATDQAQAVLSVHGERSGDRPFVMVGGLWDGLRMGLRAALDSAGFIVEGPRPGLTGRHPENICNRGRLGAGGPLELSESLRALLRESTVERDRFVDAVREVLLELEEASDWPPVEPVSRDDEEEMRHVP